MRKNFCSAKTAKKLSNCKPKSYPEDQIVSVFVAYRQNFLKDDWQGPLYCGNQTQTHGMADYG